MSIVSGARFGAFEVLERIGAGGMGEVYRARDTRLERIVALKVIRARELYERHWLELLIESRPKALSKSQLHDRLWPNTFVVEANLSNLIGEVRRALDNDPRQPRYVRTVHRFGYAFRADPPDIALSDTGGVLCA
jgi:DNA-binding winged helix-turn-helix (wHTH) protein